MLTDRLQLKGICWLLRLENADHFCVAETACLLVQLMNITFKNSENNRLNLQQFMLIISTK